MKITICGSMDFAKEMQEIKDFLVKECNEVTAPAELHLWLDDSTKPDNKWEKLELDVFKNYFKEISHTDAILVVNKNKKGIENYIGGNSLIEMAFAHILDKKIFLFNPIPQMSYTDEIEAMKPIIINRDLSLIN
ncbi:MAG: hypothetical protein V1851_00135 [Patescibacteria group bacterium]